MPNAARRGARRPRGALPGHARDGPHRSGSFQGERGGARALASGGGPLRVRPRPNGGHRRRVPRLRRGRRMSSARRRPPRGARRAPPLHLRRARPGRPPRELCHVARRRALLPVPRQAASHRGGVGHGRPSGRREAIRLGRHLAPATGSRELRRRGWPRSFSPLGAPARVRRRIRRDRPGRRVRTGPRRFGGPRAGGQRPRMGRRPHGRRTAPRRPKRGARRMARGSGGIVWRGARGGLEGDATRHLLAGGAERPRRLSMRSLGIGRGSDGAARSSRSRPKPRCPYAPAEAGA